MNNRQGGRRRGRGGQRPQGMPGNSGGNARDNRQRGNAAQLLEKYKGLARDAQLAGDRVQTEYYLQFADHYFRVLSESRSRFEEQRRARGEDDEDEDYDGDDQIDAEGENDERSEQPRGEVRGDRRRERSERPERAERPERGERRERFAREDRGERVNGRGRGGEADDNAAEPRIAVDMLPPAIGAPDNDVPEIADEEAPRPRRRTRRPRAAEGDEEIAPAA